MNSNTMTKQAEKLDAIFESSKQLGIAVTILSDLIKSYDNHKLDPEAANDILDLVRTVSNILGSYLDDLETLNPLLIEITQTVAKNW